MSNKEILGQVTKLFKERYPGLTAEAIICFLVALDLKDPTVGDIAGAVGMTEPIAYKHMSLLSSGGSGLISFVNVGDGRNIVHLTGVGEQAKTAINDILTS